MRRGRAGPARASQRAPASRVSPGFDRRSAAPAGLRERQAAIRCGRSKVAGASLTGVIRLDLAAPPARRLSTSGTHLVVVLHKLDGETRLDRLERLEVGVPGDNDESVSECRGRNEAVECFRTPFGCLELVINPGEKTVIAGRPASAAMNTLASNSSSADSGKLVAAPARVVVPTGGSGPARRVAWQGR